MATASCSVKNKRGEIITKVYQDGKKIKKLSSWYGEKLYSSAFALKKNRCIIVVKDSH